MKIINLQVQFLDGYENKKFFPWNNKKKMITYIVKLNITNFKIKIVEICSKSANKYKLLEFLDVLVKNLKIVLE